ncbi:hypothetical protein [Shewanella baltica]|uniref:hypothetical protein n=1 Tax=Shewanella baltica TaxID=62322 RepID=UPI00217E7AA0|nr:hypothetical protein [Shewanella baltica]MCS6192962.1 hypothetical protein [Shewanella baltica]MCS6241705.1 hypothetical protein [Shewanella baltica]
MNKDYDVSFDLMASNKSVSDLEHDIEIVKQQLRAEIGEKIQLLLFSSSDRYGGVRVVSTYKVTERVSNIFSDMGYKNALINECKI